MEIWLFYALLAAIFTAFADITEKKILLKQHAMEFSAVLSIIILIISLPFFFFIDYAKLQFTPLILLFFSSIIGSIAFLLIAKSTRHMEISEVIPLASLSPAVVSILALILLNEIPTLKQSFVIVLLIFGAFFLESKSFQISYIIKKFKRSKYIKYLFLSLLLYGITAILDRIILFNYNMQTTAYIAFAHIFLALNFLIMLSFFHNGLKGIKHGLKTSGKYMLIISIFIIIYRYTQSESIKLIDVGLVVAIKRMSTLFTVIVGGELFHEKDKLKKIITSLIMLFGAVLIT